MYSAAQYTTSAIHRDQKNHHIFDEALEEMTDHDVYQQTFIESLSEQLSKSNSMITGKDIKTLTAKERLHLLRQLPPELLKQLSQMPLHDEYQLLAKLNCHSGDGKDSFRQRRQPDDSNPKPMVMKFKLQEAFQRRIYTAAPETNKFETVNYQRVQRHGIGRRQLRKS